MTQLWTYSYFTSHTGNQFDWLRYGVTGVVIVVTVALMLNYLRHRDSARNRDLLVLSLLVAALAVAIQISDIQQNYQLTNSNNNNALIMRRFMKDVAKKKDVPPAAIAANMTWLGTGLVLKVDADYYAVTFNNDSSITSYTLTKTTLLNQKVQYIKE
ncbi:DUF3290 family protein [Schleiferilactobacillus shenzhenensis]|uniref:DUF3290 domain-containing protein n=1 Tax=Schleiferilactobacillus shenzhenensis LY-73 TaxID=1231336 RepID=U4TQR3_9LACO|nr:DUF3290 family protein [Schleiferilactobacillus shenzhenensis]ERL65785.1 hypothetical protein L248_1861 [Schleiferilactobacillus shenzhenensis LY-73]